MQRTRSKSLLNPSVWTNLAYLWPAYFAPGVVPTCVLLLLGAYLTTMSGAYHYYLNSKWQRWDVAATMTYAAALTTTVAAVHWSLWLYLILPLIIVLYARYTWDIDSHKHVPAWIGLGLVLLAWTAGWQALYAAPSVLALDLIKQMDEDPNGHWHDLWHVIGGKAGSIVVALL